MEVKEEKMKTKNNKGLVLLLIGIIIVLVGVFVIPNKEGKIKISAKTSLDRLVEKSDLETVNFTYNVIAKKCKDMNNCNLKSNDIDDFEYVVSCKGTLTAGIDFKDVKIDINKKEKKLIVTLPDATIKEININSTNFLNGKDVPASELPNARKLCEDTTKEKSDKDGKLLPAAKEQASVVLESFYEQWVKAFDKSYTVEVK